MKRRIRSCCQWFRDMAISKFALYLLGSRWKNIACINSYVLLLLLFLFPWLDVRGFSVLLFQTYFWSCVLSNLFIFCFLTNSINCSMATQR